MMWRDNRPQMFITNFPSNDALQKIILYEVAHIQTDLLDTW